MASNLTIRTRHASPYEDQALRGNGIRLLTIKSIHGTIALQTDVHELIEDLKYDAISYVWGSSPASQIMICNERLLLVTPTALGMLQYLHRYQTNTITQKIWIDAICINQEDHKEKSTQIPLMRDICSRAAAVVVWMGPSTPETGGFFAEFQKVKEKSRDWIARHYADSECPKSVKEELSCHGKAFCGGTRSTPQ